MPPTPADSKRHSQSRWAWMWLAYSLFTFIQPMFEPSTRLWVFTLASLAVFLFIFWVLFYKAKTYAAHLWLIFATFLLGLVAFPINQGADTYVVYAAAFLPFTLKSTRTVVGMVLLSALALIAEGGLFTVFRPFGVAIGWPNTLIGAALVLIVGGGNIYFADQKRADSKLRSALEENVALAAVAERERIARDLHDVLGHTLSVIVLKAELAGRLVAIDPERAVREMADVERTSRSALAEIREAIGGYRSRGLAAEIEAARSTLDAAGVNLVAETSPRTESFTPQQETALALALREAVTNIVRHAHATTCTLRFIDAPGLRRLVVEDDGPHAVIGQGNGLRGMKERMESAGGRFTAELRQAPERGLRLVLDIPARDGQARSGASPRPAGVAESLRLECQAGAADVRSQAEARVPREAAAS